MNNNSFFRIKQLTHKELLTQTKKLVLKERYVHTQILEHLAEIDSRQLHLKMGFSSLFDYAVRELGYSEGAAYRRIQAMKLCRRHPEVKERLELGRLNLTTACQLQTFFEKQSKKRQGQEPPSQVDKTVKDPKEGRVSQDQKIFQSTFKEGENQNLDFCGEKAKELIKKVEGHSSRNAEKVLAEIDPSISTSREHTRFLGGGQVEIKIVVDEECHKKLEHLKSLLAHKNPSLSYGALLAILSEEAVKKHDPCQKKTQTPAPESLKTLVKCSTTPVPEEPKTMATHSSTPKTAAKKVTRFIPTPVRRYIWQRDGGQCTYKHHETQRRCLSKHFLQIDHIKPFAFGGTSEPNNLRLLCAQHNQFRVTAEK